MSPEKQRQIASMGGKAAHEKGTAHEFTSEEARAAGRKGGAAVSKNRAHMAAIGRKGGASSSVPRLHVRQRAQEAKGKTGNEPCLKTGLSVTGSSRYSA